MVKDTANNYKIDYVAQPSDILNPEGFWNRIICLKVLVYFQSTWLPRLVFKEDYQDLHGKKNNWQTAWKKIYFFYANRKNTMPSNLHSFTCLFNIFLVLGVRELTKIFSFFHNIICSMSWPTNKHCVSYMVHLLTHQLTFRVIWCINHLSTTNSISNQIVNKKKCIKQERTHP